MGQQQAQGAQRRVHAPLHPGGTQARRPGLGQPPGAHAVHHQVGAHAPLRCADQGITHAGARAGEVEDVGFKLDVAERGIHGLHQRRKQFLRALVQLHVVVARKLWRLGHSLGGDKDRATGSELEFSDQRQVV